MKAVAITVAFGVSLLVFSTYIAILSDNEDVIHFLMKVGKAMSQ